MLLFALNLIFENQKYSMKMNKGRIFSLALAAVTMSVFMGCASSSGKKKGGGTKNFTSRTGWKPNDSKGWFFSGKKKENIKARAERFGLRNTKNKKVSFLKHGKKAQIILMQQVQSTLLAN